MSKESKAREYANWLHSNIENFYGRVCDKGNKYYNIGDICIAFETGWEEALKQIIVDASKELPEYGECVLAINEVGEKFFCHRSNEDIVKTDKYGWCNYMGSDIIAWIRNVTFDEILMMNKDVLKRLKDK